MERYETLVELFSGSSLHLEWFEAVNGNELYAPEDMSFVEQNDSAAIRHLTPHEQDIRMSMRAMFEKALQDGTKFMLFLEDDAFPHNEFDQHLLTILQDDRCGRYFFSEYEGGVLQLGRTVHSAKLWMLIKKDLRQARKQFRTDPICFNSHEHILGAFAVLYTGIPSSNVPNFDAHYRLCIRVWESNSGKFLEIIDWIDHGPAQPYDWLWGWLAKKGYVTRVAHPFLVIPYVSKTSDVDANRTSLGMVERAKKHRWELDKFNKTFQIMND